MSNFQFFVTLFGWAILFYLHNRTLKKGEITRRKDAIIQEVRALMDWLETDIASRLSHLELEEEIAARATLLNFSCRQLNEYTHKKLINLDWLYDISNIDVDTIYIDEKCSSGVENSSKRVTREVKAKFYDLLEQIEKAYHDSTKPNHSSRKYWREYQYEILGLMFGLFICLSLVTIFKFLF